jgi:predicted DNA-binding protein YlxM (UPF0122 family)
MDRSKNRSDRYQYVLVESACSPEMLTEISDSDSIGSQLNPFGYNEDLLDLKDRLKELFWQMINEKLTPRQKEVLELYCDGYTQTEIAKRLNVNQSSITKSINGNCDYKKGRRIYGGSKTRLRKLAENNQEIQDILSQMAELQDGKY